MKITLKAVTGKQQVMEVSEEDTIEDVKKRMQDEYDITSLRFCFNGAVVDDHATIKSLNLTEKDAFVIAGKKNKVVKATTVPQAEAPKEVPQSTTEAKDTPANPVPTASAQESPEASVISSDAVSPELIDSIVAMGFDDRAQIALALKAAFMNVSRAVEYLCSGIPASAQEQLEYSDSLNWAASSDTLPSEASHQRLRAALQMVPNFAEVKATYQQNKEVLPVILEQMAQRYPDLYTIVTSDLASFQRIMDEEDGSDGQAYSTASEAADSLAERMPSEIVVTAEDRMAVAELLELGAGMWDGQAAMIVYLACRKNQELAASVLLEHGGVPPELLAEILAAQSGQQP